MGVATKRYIRKPLYVDAVRVTTQNFDEIAAWCDGKVKTEEVPPGSGKKKKCILVHVLQPKNPRQTMAFVGDWLLYTNGNYKIYTNKAFRMAFDLVVAEGETPEQAAQKKDGLPPQPRHVGANVNVRDDRPKEITEAEIREVAVVAEEPDPTGTGVQPITEVVPATPESIAQAVRENEEARLAEGAQEFAEEDRAIAEGQPEEVEETTDEIIENHPDGPIAGMSEAAGETPPPTPAIDPPEVAARKRVLSEHEQQVLGPDEVRQMVRSGDVILAQDLATEQS